MKKKNICRISSGLFMGKPQLRWLREFWILIKRVVFTLKHGYSQQLQWETFAWMTDALREIFENYKENSMGSPVVIDDYKINDPISEEKNQKEWNRILDRMIELLNFMDEENPIYEDWDFNEVFASEENAKEEFFGLLSKYWYSLWD